jgi:predicted dehydrogenase
VRFLVVGLGSMGRRRIRNLRSLGHADIAGFDIDAKRASQVAIELNIEVFNEFGEAFREFDPEVLIVSTSPEGHIGYLNFAVTQKLSCFVEASVVDPDGLREIALAADKVGVFVAPSCTMKFYRGPIRVRQLIEDGVIGKPLTFSYHTGQWLPDWHPWESISDYYVSRRKTGGCREIVPFELTWLNGIFGFPEPISCFKSKLSQLDADIDDVYSFVLKYPDGTVGNILIEVLSQPQPTRELRIVGSEGILVMSLDENCVRYSNSDQLEWIRFDISGKTFETGYINPEEPYIDELSAFIAAIQKGQPLEFPNTLSLDCKILELLEDIEQLARVE